jgi:formylglycine-generating enzyme required for sulfatase activity
MAHLADLGACIDRHESIVEGGRAEPANGRIPTRAIDHAGASAACREAGFRLCSEAEWTRACAGPAGASRRFPYGHEPDAARCNTSTVDTDLATAGPVAGGSRTACVTPDGVFDLSGNVWEWTDGADGSGHLRELRGGGFANGDSLVSCVPDDRFHQPPDARFDGYGFRCCTAARSPR